MDYITQVELGLVEGASVMCALGEREDMTVQANGEDIWRGNN